MINHRLGSFRLSSSVLGIVKVDRQHDSWCLTQEELASLLESYRTANNQAAPQAGLHLNLNGELTLNRKSENLKLSAPDSLSLLAAACALMTLPRSLKDAALTLRSIPARELQMTESRKTGGVITALSRLTGLDAGALSDLDPEALHLVLDHNQLVMQDNQRSRPLTAMEALELIIQAS